jgi:DNA-binding Xre family transcriptional regulator
MVNEWAEIIGVSEQDICINIINDYQQLGQKYSVLINLYLPSLWNKGEVKKIQLGLLKVITKYLNINVSDIFILTSKIESENVVEKGEIIKW